MKRTILTAAIMTAVLAGCSVPPDEVKRVVEGYGFTDVKVGGYAFFGCSKDDSLRSEFTAKNANGVDVKGVVCGSWSPWGKAYTVRTY